MHRLTAKTRDCAPAEKAQAVSAILAVVAAIPPGRVSSYGAVAAAAGMPGRARWVGRILATAAHAPGWHRVLTACGHSGFAEGSEAHARQTQLLTAEGLGWQKGRIARAYFCSTQTNDSPLLDD